MRDLKSFKKSEKAMCKPSSLRIDGQMTIRLAVINSSMSIYPYVARVATTSLTSEGTLMKALKILPVLLLLFILPASVMAQNIQKAGVEDLRNIIDSSKGRILIINFWATWCGPCVKEFPGLMNLRQGFSEDDLQIVGISLDYSMKPVENFVKQHKVNFPIFLDDESISSMLSLKSIPRTLIYNRAGEKILDHLGFISEESFQHIVERLLQTP